MEDEKKPPVFNEEDHALEKLGYNQELKRDFSLIGIVCIPTDRLFV